MRAGYDVVVVEHNKEMREKAEVLLKEYSTLTLANGSEAATNLTHHSIDVIIAGQAFHWFDRPK